MKKTLRREKSGYTSGLIFCLIGSILLAFVIWKVWLHTSVSQLSLSELWSLLWTEQLDLAVVDVNFKLIYFAALGTIIFVLGTIILSLSQKWFTFSAGKILLQCTYCKNYWKASRAKGFVECPHCRQFIQPKVVKED